MPSRGSHVRIAIERALRVLTLLVLAFAAWNATRSRSDEPSATSGSAELRASLARWTTTPPREAHLSLDLAPNGEARDWLRALRRAGTPVTWRARDIPPLAIEVAPVVNPRGGWKLWAVAPAGARVAVADAVAPIDTVVAPGGGATVFAPVATGALSATVDGHRASAGVRDTLAPRRVLVLARATWEAKFVISALEEAGWSVDARLSVAPGIDVTQGVARLPDTARHAAVVLLDPPPPSTASAIARYVRGGGGAVLSGASAQGGGLAEIAAGGVRVRVRPSTMTFADDSPRRALSFLAIAPRADAIVLEERDGAVAAAARRVEAGRVVQLGYDESWRWRLAGGAHAVEAHRVWWSGIVSSVAYRAALPVRGDAHDDDAPLARLVDALGPSSPEVRTSPTSATWSPPAVLLFALATGFLLIEIASRRLRGAP